MLHTKFRENQSAGSRGEDFLRVFTIYETKLIGHLLAVPYSLRTVVFLHLSGVKSL